MMSAALVIVASSACGQPSPSSSSADASPVPSVSIAPPAKRSTRTDVATAVLGQPIRLATMGPLEYTITVSNLRTHAPLDMDLIMKPKRGQWILLDVTFADSNAIIPFVNPGIFRLVLPDGSHDRSMSLGGVDGTDINLEWVKKLGKNETFAAQVAFDAPSDLTGLRVSIMELDQDVAFWSLT